MMEGRRQQESALSKGGRPRNPRTQQRILKAAADLVLEQGFKALSIDAIAGRAGVGRMTIYRRWPNKSAIVMDAFFARVDPSVPFRPAKTYLESIRLNMRAVAKAYRGKDGALIRTLLAEAQFDPELATAIRERWIMPRRRITVPYFEQGIRNGFLRSDVNPNTMIDLLYGPIYFRLQMGTGALSDAYIDEIFDHAMKGLKKN
jgi:AcrR family transcriptional regulator